jgi:hypothetical protein
MIFPFKYGDYKIHDPSPIVNNISKILTLFVIVVTLRILIATLNTRYDIYKREHMHMRLRKFIRKPIIREFTPV